MFSKPTTTQHRWTWLWWEVWSLALLLVVLAVLLGVRFRLDRQALDRQLEAVLVLEGNLLSRYLSEVLDPFAASWGTATFPAIVGMTGADWCLLDASGRVARTGQGEPLFAYPDRIYTPTPTLLDETALLQLQRGETISPELVWFKRNFRKDIYLPVRPISETVEDQWILQGRISPHNLQRGVLADFVPGYGGVRLIWWLILAGLTLVLIFLVRALLHTQRLETDLAEREDAMQLESMTSTLAHELRNPLAIIQSSTQLLLRDRQLVSDQRELLGDVLEEVDRVTQVLHQHLHPEQVTSEGITNPVEFFERFWSKRQSLLASHKAELQVIVPDQPVQQVLRVPPGQLEQVLDNLLRNSLEAQPQGCQLVCEIQPDSHKLLVRLSDNGPGLGKSAKNLHNAHQSADPSSLSSHGLGLRLAGRWLRSWGGNLVVRNRRKGWLRTIIGVEAVLHLPYSQISGDHHQDSEGEHDANSIG